MPPVQYRVVGRCPQCASEVVLLDAADRLPPHHTAKGKAVCSFQGDPVRVRRISEPPPARTSTSARKLSRKQAKRAKQRAIQAVIRGGATNVSMGLFIPAPRYGGLQQSPPRRPRIRLERSNSGVGTSETSILTRPQPLKPCGWPSATAPAPTEWRGPQLTHSRRAVSAGSAACVTTSGGPMPPSSCAKPRRYPFLPAPSGASVGSLRGLSLPAPSAPPARFATVPELFLRR